MTEAGGQAGYGSAAISPDVAVAGQFGTWRLSCIAGEAGIAVGGGFRVYTDTDSDWGTAQLTDPTAAEYLTAEAPDGVRPVVTVTGVKSLRVTVRGRELRPGETITLVIGDTRGGSPGSRAQTFFEEHRYFWIDVDADGSGNWHTLRPSPEVRVVSDDAVRLVVTAIPSTTLLEEKLRLIIKAEDRWGNPAASYTGTVELGGEGFQCENRRIEFTPEDGGVRHLEDIALDRVGVLRIAAIDAEQGLRAMSNPVVVVQKNGEQHLYWADPHGGQLVHNRKFVDFFRYARDVSGVQFVGFQRNADVISAEDWEMQQAAEREYSEPGRFVPIPGYEWSGRTWEGGHHNIYFRRHGQQAKRNLAAEDMFQAARAEAELAHITDVYAAYRNTDTMITPHVGGEHSDITFHEPRLEPAVEISSTHGSFEWMLFDSLKRGYRMGFLGGSDCYTGRPGDDRPGHQLRRYAKSSLTGIYARGVTLQDFFEAMRARRVYATTGARIVLSFDIDGEDLGAEYTTAEPPTVSVAVAGTAPLEQVDLFRGTKIVYSHPLGDAVAPNRVRILWNGSSRMTSYSGVIWDGTANVRGARIAGLETVRFDSPRSHVVERTDNNVRWHAWGCGYPQGMVLELDGFDDPADVEIQIAAGTQVITGPAYGKHGSEYPRRTSFAPSEHAAFTVRMIDVLNDPADVPMGVLDRHVTVSGFPTGRPLSADFQALDDKPLHGCQPYWLRVIQQDGEMAWSSPIFVDYAGE